MLKNVAGQVRRCRERQLFGLGSLEPTWRSLPRPQAKAKKGNTESSWLALPR